MQGAEEFSYLKGKVGCLLSHGFTGAPYEMHELGKYLAGKGISVVGPRLPGHGTSISDMISTNSNDWYREYLKAYRTLADYCEEVFIGGLSMGGVLTLKCAAEVRVQGIIAMATPVKFDPVGNAFLPIFGSLLRKVSIKKTAKEIAYQKEKGIVCYERNPIGPANSLRKLIKGVRKNLGKITDPILIMQGLLDSKWVIKSSKIILEEVSSQEQEIIFLRNSPHCFTVGPEKDKVNESVFDFISRYSKIP
ncbi:MAG: alpha/beta hydrolase, partial [Candidatus Heimdallarchaeota archaeon]